MTLRYLALGDSYTCGEGVAAAAAWPAQLAAALRDDGIAMADPEIVAVTGWTTGELAAGMDRASLAPRYDLVSLLIGVNDQYRGAAVADYGPAFCALLERALAFAGGRARRVLAVSIPDWGVTPFARAQQRDGARVAREIDAYNALARARVERRGAPWIDVTGISRQAASGWIGSDGLHPTARQYAAWTRAILPAARAALARPTAGLCPDVGPIKAKPDRSP